MVQADLLEVLKSGIEEIFGTGEVELCDLETLAKRLSKFYDEITLFNPTYALVNASDKELVTRHILDCLAPVPIMAKEVASFGEVKVADLGSGAGLPGIVLASTLSGWDFTLVERMGRRAGFLRNTLAVLGLSKKGLSRKVEVLQKDLSEVQNQYNIITFRAFRAFKDIVFDLDRILLPKGKIFAYKSSDENIEEEIKVVETLLPGVFTSKVVPYSVPFCDAKRQLLILEKR